MNKILEGKNIIKTYGEGTEKNKVLNEVSIAIENGEFLSIMGPSGSGKSTLMYLLSGMDNCTEGHVLFDEKDLSSMDDHELSKIRRTKMGFVFQQASFLKNLNIIDNISLLSVRSNPKNVKAITEKAKLLMKKVGIQGLENREITKVSGGQLQRAGICRALMNDPQIIFGDEPTGALNSKSAEEIMDILTEINRSGTTIILVTHDAKVASQTEHIMFMSDGKITSELRLSKYDGTNIEDRKEQVLKKMNEIGI